MKIIVSILLNICLSANALCQDPYLVDSLNKLLFNTDDNTVKGLAIRSLIDEYVFTKPDSCLYYTNMGLELIKDKSIEKEFENAKMYSFEQEMYSQSAVALSEVRNDSLAVKFAFKASQLAENSKDKDATKWAIEKLGEVYQNIDEPGIAIEYYERAISLETSSFYRQIFLGNLGAAFYDAHQYDSALFYLNKINMLIVTQGNKPWSYPDYILGSICIKKEDYKKAMHYFQIAKNYSEQSYAPLDICQEYVGMANAFEGLGILDSALWYTGKSLQLANKLSLPIQSLAASTLLSDLYESKGKIDSAFKYQKISNKLRDTLFSKEKIRQVQNFTFNEKLHQKEISDEKIACHTKIKFYGLTAGLILSLLLVAFVIRNNKQKQKANSQLNQQKDEIKNTLTQLRSTQSQLIQSEKMASLGELTAGIAHEIQNPLNFVNNFSDVNTELIDEAGEEMDKGNISEAKSILSGIKENEQKINHHGKRAGDIVKGMLQHSRSSTGVKEPTDINKLADEYLRLSYHGLRAKDKSFNAVPIAIGLVTEFDKSIGKINIIPQDIGRVLLNLFNNAFYAVTEKAKLSANSYQPTVSVTTKRLDKSVIITVSDNGNGIPQNIVDKIFQPFFTTKPTGSGTGLGLSLSYDIVKAHGGEIKVESREGEGTGFIIQLPLNTIANEK